MANSTDPVLGRKVRDYLISFGLETPIDESFLSMDENYKIQQIEELERQKLKLLGLDLTDDSLQDTPSRMAKMYVTEFFQGLKYENFPKCTTIENKMTYDEMIICNNITVLSNCEHHFVVFDGFASVGYIPKKKVLGLSKINRIVEYFSKRPQVQERLTEQVCKALCYVLETDDVAVTMTAKHYCVAARGIKDVNSNTITSKLSGVFRSDPLTRQEYLTKISKN